MSKEYQPVTITLILPSKRNWVCKLPGDGSHFGADYGYLDGTSMATPFVAGLAGLVWSEPGINSNDAVRKYIISGADTETAGNIYSKYKIPRINALKTVAAVPQ